MVLFAKRSAAPHPRLSIPSAASARSAGIRWFHEPGAWVERSRYQPGLGPSAESPILSPDRLRWTLSD